MTKAKYLKRVKANDFQLCMDQITPFIYDGDFDRAFEILDEFRIGPNTMNPRDRNFVYWLIEAQSKHGRSTTEEQRQMFFEFSKLFVDRGVELDHQDRYGITLLNWSVWTSCSDMCLFLLERGASPNIADINGLPPLGYSMTSSARWNDREMVNKAAPIIVPALLRAGADPYFAYPTYEEAKDNPNFSWALNGKRDGVVSVNFIDNIVNYSQIESLPPEQLAVYKLFFATCKELNLLKE